LATRAAPDSAPSQAFATGPEPPARLRDAVLQRYHSNRRGMARDPPDQRWLIGDNLPPFRG